MKVTFDPDFDSSSWPGPLGALADGPVGARANDSVSLAGRTKRSDSTKPAAPARTAVIGESWAGPLRLQGILETALGLGGLFPFQSERTAAMARAVRTQEGFWSASAEKDPIGVARTLLRWIDWLRLHGWEGQALTAAPASGSATDQKPCSPVGRAPAQKPVSAVGRTAGQKVPSAGATPHINRLYDLSLLLPHVLPGSPDRLIAISAALDKRRPDIESIDTLEPIDRLVPLWRKIFAKLEDRGVAISHSPTPSASSKHATDLRRCLSPEFAPASDGSLILFRPYSPLDAAESVAAYLRAHSDISETLIINPDVILDDALRRFGLPVTGANETTNDDPFLQVLPLVLAMGWDPPDPQRALELLIIPDGPIPGSLARALRSALQQWPAIGSPSWDDALASGFDTLSPPARRDSVRDLLTAIFRPDAAIRTAFPAPALNLRAQVVRTWAAARRFASTEQPSEMTDRLDAVIGQCNLFEKLIKLSGFESLTEPQLLKLVRELTDATGSHRRYPPQAGISVVNSPAAVAGPARHVIWWDFALESAQVPFSIPLSRTELAALDSAGVTITPAANLASDHSRRWRRPFAQASETLLLVCPTFGEDGEERHHHPLWDEVMANFKQGTPRAALETKTLDHDARSKKRRDPLLPVPRPRRSWAVDASMISPARSHSPSSMGALIGCPFKWALTYLAKLRDPEIAALTENSTMLGTLSHEILAETLRSNPTDGLAAQKTADDLFVRLGPKLAAPLFLPGAPFQISFARKATADAARVLVDHLKGSGLPIVAVETSVSKKLGPLKFNGRADLVVGDPPVVIDLKWSGGPRNREHLKNGTAFQVAAYAFMLQSGRAFPEAAYFILRDQRLIALKSAPFANAETIDGPPLQETWNALLAATRESLDVLANGRIEALGVPLEDDTGVADKDALAADRLILAPPCKFCSFGFLCGRDWGDVQ